MFGGKTNELIRRLRQAQVGNQRVQAFKPALDGRYDQARIVSHDGLELEATAVIDTAELNSNIRDEVDVVGLDEAQFFNHDIIQLVEALADRGVRVVVAGLDQDYRGTPFDPMPQIMAIAESVTKFLAVCSQCGQPAHRSQRIIQETGRVLIGGADIYEPRCRICFQPPTK